MHHVTSIKCVNNTRCLLLKAPRIWKFIFSNCKMGFTLFTGKVTWRFFSVWVGVLSFGEETNVR